MLQDKSPDVIGVAGCDVEQEVVRSAQNEEVGNLGKLSQRLAKRDHQVPRTKESLRNTFNPYATYERIRYTQQRHRKTARKSSFRVAILSARIYASLLLLGDEFRYMEGRGTSP